MQPFRDGDGHRLLLVETSGDRARVYDPATGEHREVDRSGLTPIEDPPLAAAAAAVPEAVRTLLLAIPNARALGLVVTLADRGPLAVRTILAETTLCESDLNGLLASLTAAGVIEERDVGSERGYAITDSARRALESIR